MTQLAIRLMMGLLVLVSATSNLPSGSEAGRMYFGVDFVDGGATRRAALDGTEQETINSERGFFPLEIDTAASKLLGTGPGIVEFNVAGCEPETVVPGVAAVGLAFNVQTRQIYWIQRDSSTERRIRRADRDGSGVETLLVFTGEVLPESLDVDPVDGYVFWSLFSVSGGSDDDIYRANPDGSDSTRIVTTEGAVTALAVDDVARRLYWIEADAQSNITIRSSDLAGDNPQEILFQPLQITHDLEIDTVHGRLYWSAEPAFELASIYRANLDGTDMESLTPGLRATGIALDPTGAAMDETCGRSVPATRTRGIVALGLILVGAATLLLVRRKAALGRGI